MRLYHRNDNNVNLFMKMVGKHTTGVVFQYQYGSTRDRCILLGRSRNSTWILFGYRSKEKRIMSYNGVPAVELNDV